MCIEPINTRLGRYVLNTVFNNSMVLGSSLVPIIAISLGNGQIMHASGQVKIEKLIVFDERCIAELCCFG